MYQASHIILSKEHHKDLHAYAEHHAALSKCLYNAALFRIRQIFTGYDKQDRTDNEKVVFSEVARLEAAKPSIRVRRVISYGHLENLMRVTENPDFFAGLPMQTAQAIVNQAVQDFKNWLASLKAYKKEPSGFLGKPKMPKYKKQLYATFTITNQDAVLYPVTDGNGSVAGTELKLPLTKIRTLMPDIPASAVLKEVKFIPYYGRYILSLTLETEDTPVRTGMSHTAAIDFGTDNIAAIVCTDQTCRIYKGGAILSENRHFAKRRAEAVSILTQGHKHRKAESRYLTDLSYHHANFNKDQMHKISADIIRYCMEHNAGTLILGVNKNWKQNVNLGSANNQKFVTVPLAMLWSMIRYKAARAGITVLEQEESYTSKADVTAGDTLPVYGKETGPLRFSGVRVSRGLYRCHNGLLINADCNGAANIMRKADPGIWNSCMDFSFLSRPDVCGFHELNPSSIPVKRIGAA